MLHKLLQRVSRLGHKSKFETYVASLQEGRRSGVPTLTEASRPEWSLERDFQSVARYKMLSR